LKSNIYEHKQRDYSRPDWFSESRKKTVEQNQNKEYLRMDFLSKNQEPTISSPRFELTQIPDALSLDDFLSSHPELTASTNLNSPEYIPDENFRNKICEILGKSAGSEYTVEEAVAFGSHFTCSNSNISDLKGIEYFPNLILLNCNNNLLTSIDITKNTRLLELFCNDNQLTNLNIDNNPHLKLVNCVNNNLTGLDVKNSNVYFINCEGNLIESVNLASAPSLKDFICSNNSITSLDVSSNELLEVLRCNNNLISNLIMNSTLKELHCGYNQIEELDLSNCENLEKLSCYSNKLTSLILKSPLIDIDCSDNQIFEIDLSQCETLEKLTCRINNLTNLSINSNLKELYCGGNSITSLDFSNSSVLEKLECSNNKIKDINLTNLEKLYYINISSNLIRNIDVRQNSNLEYINFNSCFFNDISGLELLDNLISVDVRYNELSCDDWDVIQQIVSKIGEATYGTGEDLIFGIAYNQQFGLINFDCDNYPVPSDDSIEIKTLVLNLDPIVPSMGMRVSEAIGNHDPHAALEGYIHDVLVASKGYINYQIIDWYDIDEFPEQFDGFKYDPDDYVSYYENGDGWRDFNEIDYEKILKDYNVIQLINDDLIDEIIIITDHWMGAWESNMVGPEPLWINGNSWTIPELKKNIAIQTLSNERAPVLHNLGHRAEATLTHFFGGWRTTDYLDQISEDINFNDGTNIGGELPEPEDLTPWELFAINYDVIDTLMSADPNKYFNLKICAGNVHIPPNGDSHYDYEDDRIVNSTATDWPNYPNLTGISEQVSKDTWSGPPYEKFYLIWWFDKFPRNHGFDDDGRDTNWWNYIFRYNDYFPDGTKIPESYKENVNTSEYFPDENFRLAVEELMEVEPYEVITRANIANKTGHFVCSNQSISSVTGINLFENIVIFDCSGNNISSLKIDRKNILREIHCFNNPLVSLEVTDCESIVLINAQDCKLETFVIDSVDSLERLNLNNNRLKHLTLNAKNLNTLQCDYNQRLETLNLQNASSLTFLSLIRSKISSLDLTSCEKLETLLLTDSALLTDISISNMTPLETLELRGCALSDISFILPLNTLNSIDISYNQLDCQSWNNILTLLNWLNESTHSGDGLNRLVYSPQKNLDPYECEDSTIYNWLLQQD
jgi:Leucine-rich repeat (LRR) protein